MSFFNFFRNIFRKNEKWELDPNFDLIVAIENEIEVCGLLLKDLPFIPSEKEVIYVSDGANAALDNYVAENVGLISKLLPHYLHFIYLPRIGEDMVSNPARWRMSYPDLTMPTQPLPSLPNDYLIQFRANPNIRQNALPPCLVRYCSYATKKMASGSVVVFSLYPIDLEKAKEHGENYVKALVRAVVNKPCVHSPLYCLKKPEFDETKNAELIKKEIDEARQKIHHLRRLGISDIVLKRALFPEPHVSPLHITADHRIILPDFDNMEIKLEPLDKAVYFLFLRHPDGIILKHIADYREELAQLYERIKDRRPLKQLIGLRTYSSSILRLTNPLSNSLNEKLSHIRRAFSEQLNDEIASFYYVNGNQGLPKFIKLKPNMIHWDLEAEPEAEA